MKELRVRMSTIRAKQSVLRGTLENREAANATIRNSLTKMWPAKGEEKSKEVNDLISKLVDGRAKVREYQKQLRNFKVEIKEVNRAYDLAASVK